MNKQCGKIVQNSYADIVFLNTFGLTLESVDDVTQSSKIKVFDKDNVAGCLYFDNDKVIIDATYNNGDVLKASYDIPERDTDNVSERCITNIDFQVEKTNDMKLSGSFMVNSLINHEYGTECFCFPLIRYELPGREKATLKLLQDGKVFNFESNSPSKEEKITVGSAGEILHDVKSGRYVEEIGAYPYSKIATISPIGDKELHLFLNEERYGKSVNSTSEFSVKENNNCLFPILETGSLMKEIDSSMYKKIDGIRQKLLIGGVPLFDNLVSVCYDGLSDEEMNALLGIEKKLPDYQDGIDNFDAYYFKPKNEDKSTSKDSDKQLIKKQGEN